MKKSRKNNQVVVSADKKTFVKTNVSEKTLLRRLEKEPGDNDHRFRLANFYYENGHPEKAVETAVPLWGKVEDNEEKQFLRLCRLLAFACTQVNRPEEALKYAKCGLKRVKDGLDFYFVLTIIAAMKRDYMAAAEHAEVYLKLWDEKKNTPRKRGLWDDSFALRYQLLNAYGIACIEKSKPEKAERSFREGIKLKKDFDSNYINLALLLSSLGRNTEATEIVEIGLKNVPQSAGLRSIVGKTSQRATISVCMIVKNEEKFLPQCLKSIQGMADEIILVDTGSEDRTIEIAEEFDCRIFHFPWQGDFSSARNESLKHATGDWIFIIDADEELAGEQNTKVRFFTGQPDLQIISISVYNKSLETGVVSSFLPSVRLFRRDLNLAYHGIVHNRLNLPPDITPIRCNISLFHYGYDLPREALDKKLDRSQALLKRQLEEKPDDVFANFNMAQLLFGYGHSFTDKTCLKIIEHASKVIDNPESGSIEYFGQKLMAYHQKAAALVALKRYDEAEEYCLKALDEKEDYLDAYMTLGHIFFETDRTKEARRYYRKYLEIKKNYKADDEVHNIILRYLEGEHIAWFAIGLMAQRENKIDEAIEAFHNSLKEKDNYRDSYCRLGKLYLDRKEPAPAEEMFRREVERDNKSAFAHFGLGDSLSMQGKEAESTASFEAAVGIQPTNEQMIFRLGKTLINVGRIDEGKEKLQEAVRISSSNLNMIYEAANLVFQTGDFELAADQYSYILEQDPQHLDALNNLGNCFYKTSKFEKACSKYEQLLEKSPNHGFVYRNLGLAYLALNRREKALTALMKYAENSPEDNSVFKIIGDLFLTIGNCSDAIGCYEKYLRESPLDHLALLNLSEAYFHLGFTEAAVAGYQQVIRIDPNCESAREMLSSILSPESTA